MNEPTPGQDPTGSGPDDLVWMPTRDAAKVLKVTQRTVRKHRDAGKVQGRMVNGMWYIGVSREDIDKSGIKIEDLETEYGETIEGFPAGTVLLRPHANDQESPAVDMGPMADLIAELTQKAIDAQAAAAMYQERATQLEERLSSTTLALESGKIEATEIEQRHEAALQAARDEAARERDQEWKSKSWWQRLRGE